MADFSQEKLNEELFERFQLYFSPFSEQLKMAWKIAENMLSAEI